MSVPRRITSPTDDFLDELCGELVSLAAELDTSGGWPTRQLELCGQYGVYEWFVPRRWGGQEWSDAEVVQGYLRLAAACLTTTFILTQRTGACRRIAASDNDPLRSRLLPELVSGRHFATVGISHLTTSRRHLSRPVLMAREEADELVLDGYSPWVTGGAHADEIVIGASFDDGRQILVALPTGIAGVSIDEPARLIGLTSSHTGPVRCQRARVSREHLLAGPVENVMVTGAGANAGGLETSTLAAGLATAALDYLDSEAQRRGDLRAAADSLRSEQLELVEGLLIAAGGNPRETNEHLRARANSLALRAAQAALTSAKGAGYVVGHPAGRWCREALFFLVWSCPQPVMAAALCELAGLGDVP